MSRGKSYAPEQQHQAGPQDTMIRAGGGDGAAPPSMPGASTKKYRFELYAQAFNLLNHANLGAFSGVQTSPFFGQATSAQSPRRMELGMRVNF
jgi:hypothetical protein